MAPCSKKGLLHGVLRVVKRSQQSIATDMQLADITRRERCERRLIVCQSGREFRRLSFSASLSQRLDHTPASPQASDPSRYHGRELLLHSLWILQEGRGHARGRSWIHILEPTAYCP